MCFVSADSLLGKLSASFDQKMRILLDPEYQCEEEDEDNLSLLQEKGILDGTKKEFDDVKNSLLREKANKKVELRRSARVDRNCEPEIRRSGVVRQEPVLRQVNSQRPLKRSDSLTKKEKTEMNMKTKEGEKENKVLKLKEHFEQGGGISRSRNPILSTSIAKFDINKVRKKLVDSRNKRIKRRHTVGGTKDFTEKIVSNLNSEEKSKSSWDRLVPMMSQHELREEKDERRLSLPDCGAGSVEGPMESHV